MKKILLFAAAAAMLFACTKEDASRSGELQKSDGNKAVFHATTEGSEPDTKVFADENLQVLWNENDRISIFNMNTVNAQYMFMGEDGDTAGDFEEVPADDPVSGTALEHIYAVYPFSPDNSINNTGTQIAVNLPAEQTYKEHSFGVGANTMVAVTDGSFLPFKNVCGYLKFRFYGDNIRVTSIKFEGNNGEKIAGKAYVAPEFGGTPAISMDATATGSITLNCAEPVTLGSSSTDYTEFIFVIPPTSFTRGFKVTVVDELGRIFEKSSTRSLAIIRNKMEFMGAMKVSPEFVAVDLGLSVKWASCNVGATKPEEFGDFFAWGETEPKSSYTASNYKHCRSGSTYLIKYCAVSGQGNLDNKTVLEPEDDAASVNMGGDWRMPTRDEWQELISNCTCVNKNGGLIVTSNIEGYTDQSIFIPSAGNKVGSTWVNKGHGIYWSSELYRASSSESPSKYSSQMVSTLFFGDSYGKPYFGYKENINVRWNATPVRAVLPK